MLKKTQKQQQISKWTVKALNPQTKSSEHSVTGSCFICSDAKHDQAKTHREVDRGDRWGLDHLQAAQHQH